jgi:hypothetical protein
MQVDDGGDDGGRHDAHEDGRDDLGESRDTSRMASTPRPITSAAPTVPSSPRTKALNSAPKPSASVENPKSLGSWPTMTMRARPFI